MSRGRRTKRQVRQPMRILLAIGVLGRLVETKGCWGTLLNTVTGPIDLMVIDNFPQGPQKEAEGVRLMDFLKRSIIPFWPGKVEVKTMPDNIGTVESMQFAYEHSDHDILAFLHNDLYVYDYGWDRLVLKLFEDHPKAGLGGFFGAEQVTPDGHRGYVWNNMLEAEIHGGRTREMCEVLVLDGMSLIASRKMLDAGGGVDRSFDTHHFYDLDLSLESINRGFRNYCLPIFIHHQSGVTACGPDFQEWSKGYIEGGEPALYHKNRAHFTEKWKDYLPYRLGQPWGKKE